MEPESGPFSMKAVEMLRTIALASVAVLLLTGCGAFPKEIAQAERKIADETPDPAAVQFRNVHFLNLTQIQKSNFQKDHHRNVDWVVCGEVNARRKSGEFTGWEAFLYMSDGMKEVFAEDKHFESGKFRRGCTTGKP